MGNRFWGKGVPLCLGLFQHLRDAKGVVAQHCLGQQTETTRPVPDLIVVPCAKHTVVGNEEAPCAIVPVFATI